MNDAFQWMIDLMSTDVGRLLAGVIVLISILELIAKFKEWLS